MPALLPCSRHHRPPDCARGRLGGAATHGFAALVGGVRHREAAAAAAVRQPSALLAVPPPLRVPRGVAAACAPRAGYGELPACCPLDGGGGGGGGKGGSVEECSLRGGGTCRPLTSAPVGADGAPSPLTLPLPPPSAQASLLRVCDGAVSAALTLIEGLRRAQEREAAAAAGGLRPLSTDAAEAAARASAPVREMRLHVAGAGVVTLHNVRPARHTLRDVADTLAACTGVPPPRQLVYCEGTGAAAAAAAALPPGCTLRDCGVVHGARLVVLDAVWTPLVCACLAIVAAASAAATGGPFARCDAAGVAPLGTRLFGDTPPPCYRRGGTLRPRALRSSHSN